MTIRVGINGFGRIGRAVLRLVHTHFPELEVVAINDLLPIEDMAYLLKRDSVHGKFARSVIVEDRILRVGDKPIHLSAHRNPAEIPWGDHGVDVVIEATGLFLTQETCAAHLNGGAHFVVQSAPAKDNTPTFVYGVNHGIYNGQKIISSASCTTNGLAPVAHVMHQNFGIRRGLMTTVHATTATQKTVDGPSSKDWRRGGRGILENIIPASTGAAKAVGLVLPELKGKLTGMAFRVPTSDVSVVDLTIETEQDCDYDAICAAMKKASESGDLQGVLGYTDEELVSTDFIGITEASVFDAKAGIALDGSFFKLIAWYDNEFGYTSNLLRLVKHVGR